MALSAKSFYKYDHIKAQSHSYGSTNWNVTRVTMHTKWIITNSEISDVGNKDQNINKYM